MTQPPSREPRPAGEPQIDPARPPDPAVQEIRRERNPLKKALKVLGPGLVTGASDDDPSGIGTYAQAGASYGYSLLWTVVLMLPMMISVQYISAKIGLVSGRGLGGVLRQQYPRVVVYPAVGALVLANTLNAGADIGAIAAAINLLVPIPGIVFVIPVSLAILGLQIFGSYQLISRPSSGSHCSSWRTSGPPCSRGPTSSRSCGAADSDYPARCAISRASGGRARHHDLAVSILLAGKPGGRCADRSRPPTAVATAGCLHD